MQPNSASANALRANQAPAVVSPLNRCHWIDMPSVHDYRGNLSFMEGGRHVPFDIKRVYYLYDIPSGAERAGHAHRELSQVFIALSGSFDLVLDDGLRQETVHLSRAHMGFVVVPFVWRVLNNFSGNSVCLVLASTEYDAGDYIREYGDFIRETALRHGFTHNLSKE
jgi:hypothetical protein